MRFIFLSGGLFGFLLAGTASWAAESGAGRIFFDAACGSLIGATLVRWLWSIVLRGFQDVKPDYVIANFDLGRTFRHDMFAAYKEHRTEMPEDLRLGEFGKTRGA
jgi:hypothetical protein